ncbi:papain family cysteine protease [Oesophagostomum dentatum]|uniref:Papain family cysteine protease n=1 Tax=Oesophagostomum dentatum TaxID=61180 RepID=A0A0B1TBC1_OESDE|nr:papain family cysteine protease [Oesophagostomum dentatum]
MLISSFDARKKWSTCTSIKKIRDQSACDTDLPIEDRLGKCSGGYSYEAWEYVVAYGACSGGAYGQKGVCKQYPFHPCGYHKEQAYYGNCPKNGFSTPVCLKTCQPGYLIPYESDKNFATNWYYVASNVEAIQREIMTNGPVQAGFTVYEDFYHYSSGVYVVYFELHVARMNAILNQMFSQE